jgi:hypothetical protein
MAVTARYPFGIDDAKITRIGAGGVLSTTKVDLLGVKSFSYEIESDTAEATGDNKVLTSRRYGKRATGDLEWQASDPAVQAVLSDGVMVASGVSPSETITYEEPSTALASRYQIEVQASADDGGAYRVTILNANTDSGPGQEMTEGDYSAPSASYVGTDKGGMLLKLQWYETSAPIA